MDYSKMSDQQINEAVAIAIWDTPLTAERGEFDPCNSWADAGPIIQEHGIGIMPFSRVLPEAWNLSAGLLGRTTVKDKNVLRAAMIVFLQMSEVKDDQQ